MNTERGDRSDLPTLRPAIMVPCTAVVGRVRACDDRSRPPGTDRLRDLRSTVAITGAPGRVAVPSCGTSPVCAR